MRTAVSAITFSAVPDIPEIAPGDNLIDITITALSNSFYQPKNKDVFVFSQKIVSKSENKDLNSTIDETDQETVKATITWPLIKGGENVSTIKKSSLNKTQFDRFVSICG